MATLLLAPVSPPAASGLVLMPYFLMSDTAGNDPRLWKLASGRPVVFDRLQAAWLRLMSVSAHHQLNGYLTEEMALRECHGRRDVLEQLSTAVIGERPLLHRQGDRCDGKNCIDSSPPWPAGMDFRLCEFNKRNPTRSEHERNQAQKADRRDARLKNMVYDRDAGCCRYCRSGPLLKKGMGRARDRRRALQFDHVDPDRPAGADAENYVVACARCNELKGHRTPAEAGLVLLPEPTDNERAAWAARGEIQFDLPSDTLADNDNDKQHDNRHDKQHDNAHRCHVGCPDGCPDDSCSGDNPTGQMCPQQGETTPRQATETTSEGSGSGRGGQPRSMSSSDPETPARSGPNPQPPRGPDAPDIYHHRSRGGD